MLVSEQPTNIPANAVVPKDWAIYSSWDNEIGDEQKEYIICTQIFYPDKSPFGVAGKNPLRIEPNKRSQNIVRLNGLPIGQTGLYTVRTWIEENEQTVVGPIEFSFALETKLQDQPSMNEVKV